MKNLPASAAAGARRLPALLLGVVLLLLAVTLLAPNLTGGTELVRIRNALALGPDFSPAQDWTPPQLPTGYRAETVPPDAYFSQLVTRLKLAEQDDDWARALTISQHLLASAPVLSGGAIQADLVETHRRITQRGEGYCGDFVRVFQAMANTAGMVVRPWAFSFDGFGGHGHIWVELWNRQRHHWQLIDIFDNYYFVNGSDQPVSALEFRKAMLDHAPALALRPLVPQARPGYEIEAKAWEYFRSGLDQWYMPWGSNVFSVDAAPAVRFFSGWSRMGEGVGALASGLTPSVHLLATTSNAGQRLALEHLRWRIALAAALALAGVICVLYAPFAVGPSRARRRFLSARSPELGWPRVCVVGPLPPPSGGMANQCEQLVRLLRQEGLHVALVQNNLPYSPAWAGSVPVLRAVFRLLPYLFTLWRKVARADVVHLFANSGWAWHLFAAPALAMGRFHGVPVIVNYRGGQADEFFARTRGPVLRALKGAALCVTPTNFLHRVFARHGVQAEIIPNIIDLQRFQARPLRESPSDPHLVVTRNLERIYDLPTAIQAFALVHGRYPAARMTVAGSGPELGALQALVAQLGLQLAVTFSGRIDNADIGALYASADLVLNPSTADNMPNSLLEAMASGVPVVSTNAGGIPDMVQHEATALLVPVGDATAMADAVLRLLGDPALAQRLHMAGVREAAKYAWPQVRDHWMEAYRAVTPPPAWVLAR